MKLRVRNKRADKGVPDLLQWASLWDDGVILCKDGGLLTAVAYRGEDTASSTDERRNQIKFRLNAALRQLGTGWAFWFDSVRMPVAAYSAPEDSYFPDPITALIDEERRSQALAEGQHYETENMLVFMWTPPKVATSKFMDMMYEGKSAEAELSLQDRHVQTFNRAVEEFCDNVGDVLTVRRLGAREYVDAYGATRRQDELVNYLHRCLTGLEHGLNLPTVPNYLDCVIGGQELWVGNQPKIGDNYVTVIGIEGFPHESHHGILDLLNHMAIPYRYTCRFMPLDLVDAQGQIKKEQRRWKQSERGFVSQVIQPGGPATNMDALAMSGEAADAMTDAQSGLVAFGPYTPTIILMGPNPKEGLEDARIIAAEINKLGFATRIETVNAMEAFLGSLPGHTRENVRRPTMNSLAVADMVVTSEVWPGLAYNPCPLYPERSPPLFQGATTGATPFRFHFHVGDVGHTVVFGPTGAGKSVLLATMAAQFRRFRNATITAFDKGGSMMALAMASGGHHYDLSPDQSTAPKLCPLQHLDSEADAAWAESWIATCFELMTNRSPTPEQRGEIHRAISLMRSSPTDRSLTNFCSTVQDVELRHAMQHYTIQGALGDMLDAERDSLSGSPFSVFEIEELMNMGDKNMIPVLLYLFRRFEKSLKGQPALLILDEAWIMLGHPVVREKIREWLKVLRKANCVVVMATQSISDAMGSGIVDVLRESCPTKIFLPNEEAGRAGSENVLGPRDYYLGLGLNEAEIRIISEATKKKHYYYSSPVGRRLFQLDLGPITLAFVAASDKESVKRVKELHVVHGPVWPAKWLAERGAPVPANLEEELRLAA